MLGIQRPPTPSSHTGACVRVYCRILEKDARVRLDLSEQRVCIVILTAATATIVLGGKPVQLCPLTCHPYPVPCTAHPWQLCTLHYAHILYACGTRVDGTFLRFAATRHNTNQLGQVLWSTHQHVLQKRSTLATLAPCPVPPTPGSHVCCSMHTYRTHAARVCAAPFCASSPPTTPPTTLTKFWSTHQHVLRKRSPHCHPCPVLCTARPQLLWALCYAHMMYACGTRVGGTWLVHTTTQHTAN